MKQLEPIPKWITTYGYVGIIFLFISIGLISNNIKVTDRISKEIFYKKSRLYLEISIEEYDMVIKGTVREIKITHDKFNYYGSLAVDEVDTLGGKYQIPIKSKELLDQIHSKSIDSITFNGEIIFQGESLLKKIIRKQ